MSAVEVETGRPTRVLPEKVLRERLPGLEGPARSVSRGIHRWVLAGGEPARRAADLLHGTWLGHPLHPVLTDVTIGAWAMGGLFDAAGIWSRSFIVRQVAQRVGDQLVAIGTASAIPTALAGLTDYSTITSRAVTTGALHGLLNVAGAALNLLSLKKRRDGHRETGVLLSSVALGLLTVSAWLGGELVYRHRVGVNKQEPISKPKEWTPAIDERDLPEGQPKRVEVEGRPVLLYRQQGKVYAIGAVCTHETGPLEQGKFYGHYVECPWHQSVFDLRDGGVKHGPTTYAEPSYATRVRDGRVEIRLRRA